MQDTRESGAAHTISASEQGGRLKSRIKEQDQAGFDVVECTDRCGCFHCYSSCALRNLHGLGITLEIGINIVIVCTEALHDLVWLSH